MVTVRAHMQAFITAESTPAAAQKQQLVDLFDARMGKHYHPAFDAAFILDPINFKQSDSGAWRSPCSELTAEERTAVLEVLVRVSGATSDSDKAAVAGEFHMFMLGGLTPEMESVLPTLTTRQVREVDQRQMVAQLRMRLGWWDMFARGMFPWLARAAERLLAMHVTTAACERNWSHWGQVYTPRRNRMVKTRGEKVVFVRGNLQMEYSEPTADSAVTMRLLEEVDGDMAAAAAPSARQGIAGSSGDGSGAAADAE